MPQIFPKKANALPTLTLLGSAAGGIFVVLFIWYYFSPEYTDVGYAPEQPVEYTHRPHIGRRRVLATAALLKMHTYLCTVCPKWNE